MGICRWETTKELGWCWYGFKSQQSLGAGEADGSYGTELGLGTRWQSGLSRQLLATICSTVAKPIQNGSIGRANCVIDVLIDNRHSLLNFFALLFLREKN